MISLRQVAFRKLGALLFLSLGIFILMQVALPVLSFTLWTWEQQYSNQELVSPKKPKESILGISVQNKNNFPVIVSNLKRQTSPSYSQFLITIPRLKLNQEMVFVDSNDLSLGLVQLPGSALPGEKGNLFISGHSAVSRFLGDLGGQKAPFAKLTDLKPGDEIIVEVLSNKFVYRVSQIKAVDPSDLSVVPPPDELGRYITLMTCVPPGLNFKRLIVLGKIT